MAAQLPSVYDLSDRTEQPPMTGAAQTDPGPPKSVTDVRALLCELRDLLDAYGPLWYQESHHKRISAAVALLRQAEDDPAAGRGHSRSL